jgi:hypothetical protein
VTIHVKGGRTSVKTCPLFTVCGGRA